MAASPPRSRSTPAVSTEERRAVRDGEAAPGPQGGERYLNRELSLLEYNARVLARGEDVSLPLLERVRCLHFFGRAMDDFFQIRVAGLKEQVDAAPSLASIDGRTSDGDFKWSNDAAVCVVMASSGYPGSYAAGKKITGLDDARKLAGVKVFHAGTSKRDEDFYSSGGRVLGVTARAAELQTAVQRAYEACAKIGFEGGHYRKDIAARALKKN